jgi:hypothetical protein
MPCYVREAGIEGHQNTTLCRAYTRDGCVWFAPQSLVEDMKDIVSTFAERIDGLEWQVLVKLETQGVQLGRDISSSRARSAA